MRKLRFSFLALALLLVAAAAVAFHGDATPISWISGGDPIVVMQGQTYDWKARFCVETHGELAIANACWTATPTLGAFFGWNCEALGDLKDGPIYTIQRRLTVPEDLKPGLYSGHVAIIGTRVHLPGNAGNPQGPPQTPQTRGVVPKSLPLVVHVVEAQ